MRVIAYAIFSSLFFSHLLFHSRLKTFLFCKSFPPQPFLFSFGTDYMDSPDYLLLLLSNCLVVAPFSRLLNSNVYCMKTFSFVCWQIVDTLWCYTVVGCKMPSFFLVLFINFISGRQCLDNTVEENSSVFSSIRMRLLPSAKSFGMA